MIRILALALALVLAGCNGTDAAPTPPRPQMQAFASDTELRAFLAKRAEYRRLHPRPERNYPGIVADEAMPPPMVAAPPSPPPPPAPGVAAEPAVPQPGITNTQEADVDEGGIVKVHGQHLVVLRRGRLFTIAVGDRAMRPVDRIDAFPPGTSGQGAWYDEMLVSGDRVVVVGFSYERGGTEINRFHISADGQLAFEDSYHLRSNDYYSASNYASRLIGNRLIFYTPLYVGDEMRLLESLPGLQRWAGKPDKQFARITPATRIYVPAPIHHDPEASVDTLHTVTTCDLAAERMACAATAVLGSGSRSFYVSGNAVYVWIGGALGNDRRVPRALVYRMPLDGGRPGAVQAWGGPVDQFSFREEREQGALNVLVRPDVHGEGMWRSEVSDGEPALLHLPLSAFGDGNAMTRPAAYRPLPIPPGANWSFHNRFVGRFLLYAAGAFAAQDRTMTLFAVPLDGGAVAPVAVPHGIDRIEVMGSDAVVVGNDAKGRLGFSAVQLSPGGVQRLNSQFLTAASEGERRSQAFFYRPDPGSADGASGTLGLPVSRALADNRLARFLGSGSAVAFLRREDRRLVPAGELAARPADARDDGCQASCVDWYGNARPIFLGDRIFALMGYELVEGRLEQGRIVEVARTDFSRAGGGR